MVNVNVSVVGLVASYLMIFFLGLKFGTKNETVNVIASILWVVSLAVVWFFYIDKIKDRF